MILLSLIFTACINEPTGNDVLQDDEVSLELFLSVPEISISTKGLDDPWDEDLSDWTNWDLFTDGRVLYELTLLLIHESTGDLVGFREIYAPSGAGDNPYVDSDNGFYEDGQVQAESQKSGSSVKASFLYDHPQGGRSIEKLKRGRYLLLAVGNYTPVSSTVTGTKDYAGLKGALGDSHDVDTPFDDLIADIKSAFSDENGIPGFMASDLYKNIWTFNIVTDENHLCHKQPQPLTAVRYVELKPGMNKVEFDLDRTYVRVRFEIENNAGKETLTINNFDFCDWFTQRAVYLFNDPTDNSRNYDISASGLNTYKRSPILEKECDGVERVPTIPGDKSNSYIYQGSAIVSFSESVEILPGESKVIFDGYVFGSKLGAGDGETYQYHLDVEYKDKYYSKMASIDMDPILDVADLEAGHLYIIKAQRNAGFLITKDEILFTSDFSDIASLDAENQTYIWTLESQGNENCYFVRNLESNEYIDTPPSSGYVQTVTIKDDSDYYTFSNMTGGIQLLSTNGGRYLNHYNFTHSTYNLYGFCGYAVSGDGGNPLEFYKIDGGASLPAHFDQDVDLKLIDPVTAEVYPVKNIKRNDFINVLVSVVYNEEGSTFDITTVTGWTEKDEEIEFH